MAKRQARHSKAEPDAELTIGEVARREGMLTLRQDGMDKVRQGITSIEEVLRVVV